MNRQQIEARANELAKRIVKEEKYLHWQGQYDYAAFGPISMVEHEFELRRQELLVIAKANHNLNKGEYNRLKALIGK